MVTYAKCNTTEDAAITADTETEMLSHTIPPNQAGSIIRLYYAYGSAVDAKGATGFLEVKIEGKSGPWQFPMGLGVGGATNSSMQTHGVIECDIPIDGGDVVKINFTLAENGVSGFAGFQWVA